MKKIFIKETAWNHSGRVVVVSWKAPAVSSSLALGSCQRQFPVDSRSSKYFVHECLVILAGESKRNGCDVSHVPPWETAVSQLPSPMALQFWMDIPHQFSAAMVCIIFFYQTKHGSKIYLTCAMLINFVITSALCWGVGLLRTISWTHLEIPLNNAIDLSRVGLFSKQPWIT